MAEAVLAEWKRRDPLLSDIDGFLKDFNKAYARIERETEKEIGKMIRALTAPIIVYPGGWHDTIPDWMKAEVTLQRMVQLIKGEEGMATDVEALTYLYTTTLVVPFNESWTNIYVYLTKRCMEARGKPFPNDLGNPTLTEYQQELLNDLKKWLWDQAEKAFARVKSA